MRSGRAGGAALLAGLCLLAGCNDDIPPPDFRPVYLRAWELETLTPPPLPPLRTDDTSDEAEIQFRAAFQFYKNRKYNYAAVAFDEAVDYNPKRIDALYYHAASLVLAGRENDALAPLEILIDTDYEIPSRYLLAVALYRLHRGVEAREAIAPAAAEDYRAAAWASLYDLLIGGVRHTKAEDHDAPPPG